MSFLHFWCLRFVLDKKKKIENNSDTDPKISMNKCLLATGRHSSSSTFSVTGLMTAEMRATLFPGSSLSWCITAVKRKDASQTASLLENTKARPFHRT